MMEGQSSSAASIHNTNANNPNNNEEDDEFDIAFAAEAAANAVEEADAIEQQRLDEQRLRCLICGQGSEEGRPVLQFKPVDSATAIAPPAGASSFAEDIALHIFCGKTASILPSVNRPELEVLTKAGLKNKHGIGPEVNAALARTRCATTNQEGAKEKQFYLVREFEAHLEAIRQTHVSLVSDASNTDTTTPAPSKTLTTNTSDQKCSHNATSYSPQQNPPQQGIRSSGVSPMTANYISPYPATANQHSNLMPHPPLVPPATTFQLPVQHQQRGLMNHVYSGSPRVAPAPSNNHVSTYNTNNGGMMMHLHTKKQIPVRAAAGAMHKPGAVHTTTPPQQQHQHQRMHPHQPELTEEGKVRCDCGGTHWPIGSPRGAASWRGHVMTKRHQKWMEHNGLLGS